MRDPMYVELSWPPAESRCGLGFKVRCGGRRGRCPEIVDVDAGGRQFDRMPDVPLLQLAGACLEVELDSQSASPTGKRPVLIVLVGSQPCRACWTEHCRSMNRCGRSLEPLRHCGSRLVGCVESCQPATRPAVFGMSSRMTVLVSRNGSRPSVPPSRPIPDCLKPPKAMLKSVRKELWPTVPERN